MQKRLMWFGALLICASLLAAPAAHADTQDFTVDSFTADYYLSRATDGVAEMAVTETVVAEFPEYDQNHGILRAIPESYQGHSLELHVESVQKPDGSAWQYTTSTDNGNDVLKIGDPDVFVHSKQTYVISYRVRGVANDQQNDANLFWNVNGDQWPQQFASVTAKLHVPQDLLASIDINDAQCYAGPSGSTQQDCVIIPSNETGGGKVLTISTMRPLNGYETLSYKVALKPGSFSAYRMSSGYLWRLVLTGAAIALPVVVAAVVLFRKWRKYGRDAKGRGVIVPQYLPPKEASVMASSAILKERFAPAAISATIIDLAVRHYIKVYETGKKFMSSKYNYDLELVKDPKDLRTEEKAVVDMIFAGAGVGTRVALKDLDKQLYVQAQQAGRAVDEWLTAQGYFVKNPDKVRVPYLVFGFVCIAVSFIWVPYTLGFIGAGLVCFIGVAIIAARTPKGAELKDYLLGLRDYMKLAEADRLKVLQAPQGSLTVKIDVTDKGKLVKLYERLLPYAMLFGIEKEWAKQFADLYTEQPDWYSGSGAFNAVYFAGALSSFGSQTAQSFAPPSSSGGGSGAGGGGGGGGGGGW